MYYSLSPLFNKEVAIAFDKFIEMLMDDLYDALSQKEFEPKVVKPDKRLSYFGLEIKSKTTNESLFCGMHYDVWESKESPLTLVLIPQTGRHTSELSARFKRVIDKINVENLAVVNIDNVSYVYFERDFFANDIVERMATLISRCSAELNFGVRYLG